VPVLGEAAASEPVQARRVAADGIPGELGASLGRHIPPPESSVAARVVALWSVVVILLSVVVFCVETIPGLGKLRRFTVRATVHSGV